MFRVPRAVADEIERLREDLVEANEQVGDLIDDAAAGDPKDRVWVLVTLVAVSYTHLTLPTTPYV